MKTFTLQFLIDETARYGGWDNPCLLAIKLKLLLDGRYGFDRVVDVQPRVTEKPKPIRKFCLVKK